MTHEEAIEACATRNASASEADERLWVPRRLQSGEWGVAPLSRRRQQIDDLTSWQPEWPPLMSGAPPIDHREDVSPAERIRRSRRADRVIRAVLAAIHATVPATAVWLVIRIASESPSTAMRVVFGAISLVCLAVGAWWLYLADVFAMDSADIDRRHFHVRASVANAKIPVYEHRISVMAGTVIGLGCAGALAALT